MAEFGLIMSGWSVRAMLAGCKTMTRRVVTHSNSLVDGHGVGKKFWEEELNFDTAHVDPGPSPAGNMGPYLNGVYRWETETRHRVYPRHFPGDVLRVKEALKDGGDHIQYVADDSILPMSNWPWKRSYLPAIFCPAGVSRIRRDLLSVRPERLHAISEEDAIAEGVDAASIVDMPRQATWNRRHDYAQLWNILNARRGYPWYQNNFVWVYEFSAS